MTNLKIVNDFGLSYMTGMYTPIVSIYANVSCPRNGSSDQSAGGGAVIVDRNRTELKLLSTYLGAVTSQQAEILACTTALEKLRRPCRVEMFSDSRYVVDTMNGKNQMKCNRSFWMQLVRQSYGHHLTWRWIQGQGGLCYQVVANRLASAASATGADMLPEDLEFLTERLANDGDQQCIRSFEIEIEKIVDRYRAFSNTSVNSQKFCVMADPPSAFSS